MRTLSAPGTGTLTDRYVAEVVRRIPAGRRGDVAEELSATIADTAEARRRTTRRPPNARYSPRWATRSGSPPATRTGRSP